MRKSFIVIIITLAAWNMLNTIAILKSNSLIVKAAATAMNQATKQDSIVMHTVYKYIYKMLDMNIKQTKADYEYLRQSK